MSATTHTVFDTVTYESDILNGDTDTNFGFLIRVLPQVLLLQVGDVVNGVPDSQLITLTGLFASINKSKRRYGLRARAVIISRYLGTSPAAFRIYRKVPLLTLGIAQQFSPDATSTISYQGQTDWNLVSIQREEGDVFEYYGNIGPT